MNSSFFRQPWIKSSVEHLSDHPSGSDRRCGPKAIEAPEALARGPGGSDLTVHDPVGHRRLPHRRRWDTPGHWIGGVLPTSTDNAQIELTGSGTVTTGPSDSVLSLTTTPRPP